MNALVTIGEFTETFATWLDVAGLPRRVGYRRTLVEGMSYREAVLKPLTDKDIAFLKRSSSGRRRKRYAAMKDQARP